MSCRDLRVHALSLRMSAGAALLAILFFTSAMPLGSAAYAQDSVDSQDNRGETVAIDSAIIFPSEIIFAIPAYPVWLSRVLAPLGISSMQASLGFLQLHGSFGAEFDVCAGLRNLQKAAVQGDKFAVYWMITAYTEPSLRPDAAKALRWFLYWADLNHLSRAQSDAVVQTFQLSAESKAEIIEQHASWNPMHEPLPEPDTCPAGNHTH